MFACFNVLMLTKCSGNGKLNETLNGKMRQYDELCKYSTDLDYDQ